MAIFSRFFLYSVSELTCLFYVCNRGNTLNGTFFYIYLFNTMLIFVHRVLVVLWQTFTTLLFYKIFFRPDLRVWRRDVGSSYVSDNEVPVFHGQRSQRRCFHEGTRLLKTIYYFKFRLDISPLRQKAAEKQKIRNLQWSATDHELYGTGEDNNSDE